MDDLIADLLQYEEPGKFTYIPKCDMTCIGRSGDTTNFPKDSENIRALVEEVLERNPHYKLKRESADTFIPDVERRISSWWYKLTYCEAEQMVISELEYINSMKWTFLNGISHCPYWYMDEDELKELSRAMEKQIEDELKLKHS